MTQTVDCPASSNHPHPTHTPLTRTSPGLQVRRGQEAPEAPSWQRLTQAAQAVARLEGRAPGSALPLVLGDLIGGRWRDLNGLSAAEQLQARHQGRSPKSPSGPRRARVRVIETPANAGMASPERVYAHRQLALMLPAARPLVVCDVTALRADPEGELALQAGHLLLALAAHPELDLTGAAQALLGPGMLALEDPAQEAGRAGARWSDLPSLQRHVLSQVAGPGLSAGELRQSAAGRRDPAPLGASPGSARLEEYAALVRLGPGGARGLVHLRATVSHLSEWQRRVGALEACLITPHAMLHADLLDHSGAQTVRSVRAAPCTPALLAGFVTLLDSEGAPERPEAALQATQLSLQAEHAALLARLSETGARLEALSTQIHSLSRARHAEAITALLEAPGALAGD